MAEYILRSEILKHKRLMEGFDWDGNFRDAAVLVEDILKIPAADVEPVKRGRWVHKILLGEQAWFCSECKTIGSPAWKRCPVCEAKMDLEAHLPQLPKGE